MARRPAAADALIALAVGVEMQVEFFLVDAPQADVLTARAALLGLAGAVALRRRQTVLAAALAISAVIVVERLGDVTGNLVGPFFVMLFVSYSVGAHAEGSQLPAGVAVLLLGSAVGIRLDRPPGGADDFFFAATILAGGPLLLGRLVRGRVKLNEALRDKAAAAERDRAARAAGAVADERARIAGELHHLVSDALASMVAQATTAERVARSQPDGAERSFTSIEETGREALGEIRRLLGCCAARTRSSRSLRSRRSPTSPTSSRGCARRGCPSSSTCRASSRHCPPAWT